MRYFSLMLFVSLLFACKQNKKDAPATTATAGTSYTITGEVTGAAENDMVVMQLLGTEKSDTAYTRGSTFEFKGATAEPVMAQIYLPQQLKEKSRPLSLVVENANINIEAHVDSLHKGMVAGGVANTDYNTLKKVLASFDNGIEPIVAKAQQAQGQNDFASLQMLQQDYIRKVEERQEGIVQYVREHPTSIAAAYFVYQDLVPEQKITLIETAFKAFDPSIAQHLYVQKIKAALDVTRLSAIGQPAPELALTTPEGKKVALSSLKGKYVLVDFWASWCQPCRQENPNVVAAFNKYKNKGFTVLGVSLDENKAAWKQAIAKDGLTWPHVSDLQGWSSPAAQQYGVQAIPANFLLDKQGVIIAKNLREEALHNTLEEVLK